MSAPSPDLRFGIEGDGRRSRCWRVRSGAHRPELFIEPEGLGHAMHVSLHASGRWHVKVQNNPIHRWLRPTEFHPGFTRALLIVQPQAVNVITAAPPADAVLVQLPADTDDPVHFNVGIEGPGANLSGWPGKVAMGTKLLGRVDLAGGAGTCVVTSHIATIGEASLTIPKPSDEELKDLKARAAAGTLHGTMIAELDDGTVCFLDGTFKPPMLV
jgi:hypothetical protein